MPPTPRRRGDHLADAVVEAQSIDAAVQHVAEVEALLGIPDRPLDQAVARCDFVHAPALRVRPSGGAHLVPRAPLPASRDPRLGLRLGPRVRGQGLDGLLDAGEDVVVADRLAQAQPAQRVMRIDSLEPGDGERDALIVAVVDHRFDRLGGGVVDVDDAGRLEHQELERRRGAIDALEHRRAEGVGVDEGERGLEPDRR